VTTRSADRSLAGPRLRLERLGVERARALAAGDLSVVRAAEGWPHRDSLDAVRMDAAHASCDEDTGFLAVLTASGLVVGEAGWKGGPDSHGDAEIGYGLAAPYRRQGLGTELVALVSDWAQAQEGVRRVVAEVLADNLPSRRALERNGFRLDRVDPPHVWYARPVGGTMRA
jgi:RimJ/RimL family protein N-acetyltransferase